ALQKFFTEAFEGTLITDFWSPYDAVVCADKQKCWPHLLRDAAAVSEKHGENRQWRSFSRCLVGVCRDAKKLHPQNDRWTSRTTILLSVVWNNGWASSVANHGITPMRID
ncbi:MAG: transposase, partial [Planctomycetota bacterium]